MFMLFLLGFLTLPFGLLGAIVAVLLFKGIWWRTVAGLPLLAVAAYFAIVLIPDWGRDPTSHNLFPFELGMYYWPVLPYIVGLATIYWRTHRPIETRPPPEELKYHLPGWFVRKRDVDTDIF